MSNTIYSDKIKVNCPLIHDENGYFHLVYQITNLVNEKVYVGKHSTKDPYDGYMGSGLEIGRAIEKYGIENFTKEILYCFSDEKEAYLKEAEIVNLEFINREDTYNIVVGGNMIGGAWGGENHPMYGKHLPQEVKDKISNTLKGKMTGEKHPFYGKTLSQETKDRISQSRKGKCVGEKNPNFGKHPNEETRDKMSKSHIGKKHKPETLKKMSEARKGEKHPMYGKHLDQKTRDKISNSRKGQPSPRKGQRASQETKEKLSKSLKGIHAGEKNPSAKIVLKLDKEGNVIFEYGCVKECCVQENISWYILKKLIRNHIFHNESYFEFKFKN